MGRLVELEEDCAPKAVGTAPSCWSSASTGTPLSAMGSEVHCCYVGHGLNSVTPGVPFNSG